MFGLAAALILAPFAQNSVWVVDDDGGPDVDYLEVRDAVAAAQEGDTILVRDGQYMGVHINRKGLTLQGDPAANIHGISVTQLKPGQVAAIRGISGQQLWLRDNSGSVWVEECDFFTLPNTEAHAVWIQNCASVVLAHIHGMGSDRTQPDPWGFDYSGDGARIEGSEVHVFECQFEGGDGWTGYAGATGLQAKGTTTTITVAGCEVRGGPGGGGDNQYCAPGAGGAGILLSEAIAYSKDNVIEGGPGGTTCSSGFGCNCSGEVGPTGPAAVQWSGANLVHFPGLALRLTATAAPRVGETVMLDVQGPAQVAAFMGVHPNPVTVAFPGLQGALLLDPNGILVAYLGVTSASGALQFGIPVPPLVAGMESQPFYVQIAHLVQGGGLRLGSGSMIDVIHEGF